MSFRVTCSLTYYALSLNAGSLHGNIYLNVFLYGAVEVPATVIVYFMMDSKVLGRKWTGCISLLGAGISNFISILLILSGRYVFSHNNNNKCTLGEKKML